MASTVINFRSQIGLGAWASMPTSLLAFWNPIISTWIDQIPSAKSANEYMPCSSVVVMTFLSPRVAVTVAPGMGNPPDRTTP
jgi:hypothetical protein